ncbi:MAG: hypothetical protein E7478_07490 [Ruminococcaceae bacterium]|nr:hypothetical protein [Oscillospiraceae bacterium]
MKLLRRPMLAAAIAVAADVVVMAAAVLLDVLRGRFTATYTFDPELVLISESHPYDMFGVVVALAMVLAAVMAAFIIAGGFTTGGGKVAQRITGGVLLVAASVAAMMISLMLVGGRRPQQVTYLSYTDDALHIVVAEEKYSEELGVANFFSVNDETGAAELLVATDISTFANDNAERYTLVWTDSDTLGIRFVDGMLTRMIRVDV